MKIYIGADHRGFEDKNSIASYLKHTGHEVIDLGPSSYDPTDDYPDISFAVAQKVAEDPANKGILLCGSSIGVAAAANKVYGIFASPIYSLEEAIEDRIHHDSNILALSADRFEPDVLKKIVDGWLSTEFDPNIKSGRYLRRIQKVKNYKSV